MELTSPEVFWDTKWRRWELTFTFGTESFTTMLYPFQDPAQLAHSLQALTSMLLNNKGEEDNE